MHINPVVYFPISPPMSVRVSQHANPVRSRRFQFYKIIVWFFHTNLSTSSPFPPFPTHFLDIGNPWHVYGGCTERRYFRQRRLLCSCNGGRVERTTIYEHNRSVHKNIGTINTGVTIIIVHRYRLIVIEIRTGVLSGVSRIIQRRERGLSIN